MESRANAARVAGGLAVAVTIGFAATLSAPASAQQLPKNGTINIFTGWKDTGTAIPVAEKRNMGSGFVTGTSFNDAGSGPLHHGPANCVYTFLSIDANNGKNKGFCAFSDVDGDKIFTDWHGGFTSNGAGEGVNPIAGGTGKYAGIQGSGTWKCQYVGANGELHCNQRFDYRLP